MIRITIADEERELARCENSWIIQRISYHQAHHGQVSICLRIKTSELDMVLTTPNFNGSSGGGIRRPNRRETVIFKLWDDMGMGSHGFNAGHFIRFLHALHTFI